MDIEIKKVETASELRAFIYLPEKIHKGHKGWLPPLYGDDKKFFDSSKNAMFSHNRVVLFLAYKSGEVVGRVMGVIPDEYNRKINAKTGRFSYLECYNDKDVFSSLMSAVEDWARQCGCNQMIGPMGFSDKEPQGFITKGFDEPTMLVTACNFPYMNDLIKDRGYAPYVELCEYDVPITENIIDRYKKFTDRVEKNLKINIHEFTSRSKVKPYVKGVFDLINRSYQEIYGFTSVTEREAEEFAERFLPILDPTLIKIITNQDGLTVAFIIAMPDLSDGVRRAKGRLFPFGWFHVLRSMLRSKKLVLLLGGIEPTMQNKGLDAVLATRLFSSARKTRFKRMDSHLIMKSNYKMRQEIEKLDDFRMYKEFCIYSNNI